MILIVVHRAVNNALLDTYLLKSLDGLVEGPVEVLNLEKRGSKIYVNLKREDEPSGNDNFALRDGYDRVIRCLGWTFDDSIFKG